MGEVCWIEWWFVEMLFDVFGGKEDVVIFWLGCDIIDWCKFEKVLEELYDSVV